MTWEYYVFCLFPLLFGFPKHWTTIFPRTPNLVRETMSTARAQKSFINLIAIDEIQNIIHKVWDIYGFLLSNVLATMSIRRVPSKENQHIIISIVHLCSFLKFILGYHAVNIIKSRQNCFCQAIDASHSLNPNMLTKINLNC